MNLRADHTFVEDDGWHRAAKRYEDFLAEHRDRKVLFWELGVGYNTPGIIKYPFWQMTCHWKQVVYACVNIESADVPTEIKKKSVCIQADIGVLL